MGGGGGEEHSSGQLQSAQQEMAEAQRELEGVKEEREAFKQQLESLVDKLNVAEVGIAPGPVALSLSLLSSLTYSLTCHLWIMCMCVSMCYGHDANTPMAVHQYSFA